MISTFLVEHASVVPILLWVAIVAAVVFGWVLVRLGARRTLAVLSGLSLVGIVGLTLSPDGAPLNEAGFCAVGFSLPFQGLETFANTALFVPIALFAGLLTRRPLPVLAAASGLSAAIELVQALAASLGRACDTNDWAMNTIGAVIGALGALVVLAIDRRRSSVVGRTVRADVR